MHDDMTIRCIVRCMLSLVLCWVCAVHLKRLKFFMEVNGNYIDVVEAVLW